MSTQLQLTNISNNKYHFQH